MKQMHMVWIYDTDKLKEDCGAMTLLVLDKAFCGRYEEGSCNKHNGTLGFNINTLSAK